MVSFDEGHRCPRAQLRQLQPAAAEGAAGRAQQQCRGLPGEHCTMDLNTAQSPLHTAAGRRGGGGADDPPGPEGDEGAGGGGLLQGADTGALLRGQ